MDASVEVETLRCIGGPLNAKRVSVPKGLRSFSLESLDVDAVTGDTIPLASLATVPTDTMSGQAEHLENAPTYLRTQFVTGEHGLVEVFRFAN